MTTPSQTPPLARATAALIALVALAALIVQWVLNTTAPDGEGWLLEFWQLMRFFTILTNALVVIVWGRVALGAKVSGGVLAGTTLSIVMVGIVYQVLLAPDIPLQGARFWTDLVFHTLTPAAGLLWWLGFAPKELQLRQLPYWLIWPTGYCAYALIRGGLTGDYPYFFFDIGRFGVGFVAGYIAALVLAFAAMGVLLLGVARLYPARMQS